MKFLTALIILLALSAQSRADAEEACPSTAQVRQTARLQEQTLIAAKTNFLSQLTPDERKSIVRGPGDIPNFWKKELKKLPPLLQLDPDSPENSKIIEERFPFFVKAKARTLDLYASYEKLLYAAVNADSEDVRRWVTPSSIEKRTKELAELLIQEVQSEHSFSESQKLEIRDKLSDAKVETLASLANEPDTEQRSLELLSFLNFCGDDLSESNAGATLIPRDQDILYKKGAGRSIRRDAHLQSIFVICPALITVGISVADRKKALDFGIAHELSHIITLSLDESNHRSDGLDYGLLKPQSDYLSCLHSNYGSQTGASDSELLADRWATRVIAPLIKGDSSDYLTVICQDMILRPDPHDQTHPAGSFRIENFLRSPALKEPSTGVWCDS